MFVVNKKRIKKYCFLIAQFWDNSDFCYSDVHNVYTAINIKLENYRLLLLPQPLLVLDLLCNLNIQF